MLDKILDKKVCLVYERIELLECSIGNFEDWIFSYDLKHFSKKRPKNITDYMLCGCGVVTTSSQNK